eukprot:TRINITY_DN50933_c0_g1_i1.p1 TRINITY_DN50933_c0_g1~~TRINITY_DN50933_c0_g1_i1.p1  ORF type:complete len:380 (+),score=42.75 TRINITY_DN50933_c0_g1_i1:99-1142(+)
MVNSLHMDPVGMTRLRPASAASRRTPSGARVGTRGGQLTISANYAAPKVPLMPAEGRRRRPTSAPICGQRRNVPSQAPVTVSSMQLAGLTPLALPVQPVSSRTPHLLRPPSVCGGYSGANTPSERPSSVASSQVSCMQRRSRPTSASTSSTAASSSADTADVVAEFKRWCSGSPSTGSSASSLSSASTMSGSTRRSLSCSSVASSRRSRPYSASQRPLPMVTALPDLTSLTAAFAADEAELGVATAGGDVRGADSATGPRSESRMSRPASAASQSSGTVGLRNMADEPCTQTRLMHCTTAELRSPKDPTNHKAVAPPSQPRSDLSTPGCSRRSPQYAMFGPLIFAYG